MSFFVVYVLSLLFLYFFYVFVSVLSPLLNCKALQGRDHPAFLSPAVPNSVHSGHSVHSSWMKDPGDPIDWTSLGGGVIGIRSGGPALVPFTPAFGACAVHFDLSFEEGFGSNIIYIKINKEEWMRLGQKRKLKGRK